MNPATQPDRPFDPYVPTESEPWNVRRVSHLLRRAAFGAEHDQVGPLLSQSPAQVVDGLLDFDPASDPYNDLLSQMEGFFNLDQINQVQDWCFFRMAGTPRPAQERIALYWHNHFATSASKVENARFMHQQIELFRQKGLGSFKDLLLEVSHDPAMLVWLDGGLNRKGHPNENFAREVMELFTLGIGNYTEKDVQEIARAFTGWQINNGVGTFNPKLWDEGEKTIFGQTGRFRTETAIDLLLTQPAAPKHLAQKLLKEFLHPQPTQEQIDYYARRLTLENWQIKPVLKELFTSRIFFSDWAYRSRIKSPIELTIGAGVVLGGKLNSDVLMQSATRMGQRILFPPNVKGWDGNEAWINSNTVLVRFNYALILAQQQRGIFAERPDLGTVLKKQNATTAEQVVNYLCTLLCDGDLRAEDRAQLIDYLKKVPNQKAGTFALNPPTLTRARDVMQMIMATPEYQLA